ncbi:MAG: ATP-binding protein, partial [Calditrichota bacterium]
VEFMQANPQFKHKVKKEIVLEDGLPLVAVVYASVTQSFENLVHNALDAMWQEKDASLKIVSRSDADSVYIDVIDNGSGIPADKLGSIFDPFFTTKPAKGEAKDKEPTGTGLGLHSCVELLKPFGGRITVKSEVGKGSTFSIVLPRVKT